MKWKIPTLILLLFFLLFLPKVYADLTILQSVTIFDLVILENHSLSFQHIPIVNVLFEGFNVTLTPTSGGLNGSSGSLRMYQVTGILRFTSQNTTSYSLTVSRTGVSVRVNGVRYFAGVLTMVPNDNVVIEWGTQGIDYIGLSMGLLGIAIIIMTPAYTAYQVKKKKEYMWLAYCLLILMLGVALLTSWLVGG